MCIYIYIYVYIHAILYEGAQTGLLADARGAAAQGTTPCCCCVLLFLVVCCAAVVICCSLLFVVVFVVVVVVVVRCCSLCCCVLLLCDCVCRVVGFVLVVFPCSYLLTVRPGFLCTNRVQYQFCVARQIVVFLCSRLKDELLNVCSINMRLKRDTNMVDQGITY